MRYYRACLRYVFSSLLLTAVSLSMAGNAFAYCEASGFTGYEWISGVYFREFSNVSGGSNQNYSDYTDQVVNLIAIPNHVMLASEGNMEPSTVKYWKIWIDYNHDDLFADEETAFSGSSSELSGGPINLPATAVNGTARMRIAMELDSQIEPCGLRYGEVEDYTVSIDTTEIHKPEIIAKTPAEGAIRVPVDTPINISFAENLDPDLIGNSNISLWQGYNEISGMVTADGNVLSFVPDAPLKHSKQYDVVVEEVRDLAGNWLWEPVTWSFTTRSSDVTPPTVTQTTPQNGATDILPTPFISAVFSEPLDPQTVNTSNVIVYKGDVAEPIAGEVFLTNNGQTIVFSPAEAFDYLTTYTVKILDGVQDLAGNSLVDVAWSFTTREFEPAYCTSRATNTTTNWISMAKVGSIAKTSQSSGYANYTSIVFPLDRVNPKQISLTRGLNSSTSPFWRVFIDWNKDGNFSNDEIVLNRSGVINPTVDSIPVPANALPGNTRMRVSMRVGGYPPACGSFTAGEVEDYRVNVPAP